MGFPVSKPEDRDLRTSALFRKREANVGCIISLVAKVGSQRIIPLGSPENETELCHRVILQKGGKAGTLRAKSCQSLVEGSSQRVLMP